MKKIVFTPNAKQEAFFHAQTRYVAYGGARGGGKSWAMRMKLILLALRYEGISILLLRRTLGELRENHILPMTKILDGIRPGAGSAARKAPAGDALRRLERI